ncbi:hypothetical protein ACFY19_04175 [Streptosporangium saharense]|uniref:hypothetical protein n=1 Tax=Streptosporangium saharense TaxID=1706840 RepID=UPI0036972E16
MSDPPAVALNAPPSVTSHCPHTHRRYRTAPSELWWAETEAVAEGVQAHEGHRRQAFTHPG